MYKEYAQLIVYRGLPKDSILCSLCAITRDLDEKKCEANELIDRIHTQIKALLDLSTRLGFNSNLWHCYLTWLLLTNENSFTLTSEKRAIQNGSIQQLVLHDLAVFRRLFNYDFGPLEKALNIDCFSIVTHYQAIEKTSRMCDQNSAAVINRICTALEACENEQQMYAVLTDFYMNYGIGIFAMNKAFRFERDKDNEIRFLPIRNMEQVTLNDLVGYQLQKDLLVENTRAFVEGRNANNVLLYGDSGTGKSTSIKAIVNEFYEQGLRMIEIYKHQFRDLSDLIAKLKKRNYRYIIYMDDLSFEEFETEYKFLKAVIEGGVETRPDNILIYATSNRRHLIRETWGDRSDMSEDELHHSDTVQEKLSLVARFGLSICYERPNQKNYFRIVLELAKRYPEITLSEDELISEARKWELSHGGMSGRAAQQLIYDLSGKAMLKKWKEEKC